ncbi:MAG: ABC transporter permease [Dokdonella sp.]
MKWQRVAAIALRQFYLLRGSPVRVVPLFAWVAIDVVLWGFIIRYLDSLGGIGPKRLLPSLLGAVLLWNFFTRIMHGISTAFFEDVWSRNFLNLFASPLKISEYLGGLVLSGIATSLLGFVVMIALAAGAFGFSFAIYGLMLLPFVMILVLFGIAMGIFSTALVLRLGPAAEWLVWPIPALLSPFAAVIYPLAVLPTWMQWIGLALPPAHVFEGMRAVVAGDAFPLASLFWAAALALLQIGLACLWFSRVHRYATRSGLLARYSAESVN